MALYKILQVHSRYPLARAKKIFSITRSRAIQHSDWESLADLPSAVEHRFSGSRIVRTTIKTARHQWFAGVAV